ncbi:hypothetical protein BH18THE1_BH18THE1_03670 [soil metagenome]
MDKFMKEEPGFTQKLKQYHSFLSTASPFLIRGYLRDILSLLTK